MASRHSSGGGRRGIAPWIIVTAIAAVVVIAGTIGYILIVDSGDDEAACNSQVVLPVVSAPGAAPAISAAATAFDATAPVARSACVSTTVTTRPGAELAVTLAGPWPASEGAAPAVWVTDSEADLQDLETTDSAMTSGRDTNPLATSPVVLAVRSSDAPAVDAAGLSWQSLPAASGPNGTLTLPDGQHLLVALPDPVTNRATSYALQSVLLGASGGTIDAATAAAAGPQLPGLTGTPGLAEQPATTQDALADLLAGTGAFTAVPVVASDLAAFTAATPGLTAVSPSGPTVGDAVYAVPLTASWVTPTLDDAAALFLSYLRGPGGDTAFTDNGFEVSANGSSGDTAVDAGPEVAAALATAIGSAPAG